MPARGGDFDRAFDMLLTLGLAQPPFGSARQRKVGLLGLSLPVPSNTSRRAEIDGKRFSKIERDPWKFLGNLPKARSAKG
jgi:hypothetical protein